MQNFIEKFAENAEKYPNSSAVVSCNGRVFSYSDVEFYSAKVYSYLKEKGIGKESFVMLCLSHDARAVIAMIGVWKAGAAFTIVENKRATERIAFIREDCKCELVIDDDLFHEMLSNEPLYGYEKTDPHDACYAIYTSGSTGTPKGIIHEYGKLEQMIKASDATMSHCADNETTRFALVTPFDFAATVTEIVPRFYRRHCIYIAPMETIKDPAAFEQFFLKNRITDTAMSASLLRTYKNISPYLKTVLVTGEASNRLYIDNVRLINKYAMSESMFTVASFEIDKIYDNTPVGRKCLEEADILILDEDGEQLSNGQIGEICFKNRFFRGYINMPEYTAKAMHNDVFHSGDMGFIDESGNLIVSGRKDDMIKINGNRIEPAEIEAAVKRILNIETAIAKGFSDIRHSYITLYYLNEEAKDVFSLLDMDEFRVELSKSLPYYMIPTYYVGLDEIPLNANGKLNKKMLPEPDTNEMRADYVAPSNSTERLICEKMEKILGVSCVGINDDFFKLGGDSLHAIEFVSQCEEYNIKSHDIYNLRTPAKIAEYVCNSIKDREMDLEEMNRRAMKREQGLLPEQTIIIDQQFFVPNSDMWNIPILLKLKSDTDSERFRRAVMRAISHHPSFGTKFRFTEDGTLVQYYDPSCFTDIPVIEVKGKSIDTILRSEIKPFKLFNSPLYRAAFYKTEKGMYMFMDCHHLICDGTSITILFNDIRKCYDDENCVLPTDYYYLHVQEIMESYNSKLYQEEMRKYNALYSKHADFRNWKGCLKPDHQSQEWIAADLHYETDIKKSPETGNAFFLTAAAMAMAGFNKDDHAVLKWTFNNRNSSSSMNMTGLLYCNLPVVIEIDGTTTAAELLDSVRKQVDFGLSNCTYPFTYHNAANFMDAPIILYQLNTGSLKSLADLLDESRVLLDINKHSNVMFVMNVIEDADSDYLRIGYHYSSSNYDKTSIERFHNILLESVRFLIA